MLLLKNFRDIGLAAFVLIYKYLVRSHLAFTNGGFRIVSDTLFNINSWSDELFVTILWFILRENTVESSNLAHDRSRTYIWINRSINQFETTRIYRSWSLAAQLSCPRFTGTRLWSAKRALVCFHSLTCHPISTLHSNERWKSIEI